MLEKRLHKRYTSNDTEYVSRKFQFMKCKLYITTISLLREQNNTSTIFFSITYSNPFANYIIVFLR